MSARAVDRVAANLNHAGTIDLAEWTRAVAEGILRLRYRHSFEQPELLTPGKIEEVTVDCWSTSIIFNRGHCLRAIVTSSNHPRLDVNPGTGRPWTDSGATVTQPNAIYCSAAHPSHLVLPVVPVH